MPSPAPILIFTDLDGTLLNQHDYRFEPALPLIRQVEARGHRIILSTSKTMAEVIDWQQKLGLSSPFMIENGSAIFFPHTDYQAEDFGEWQVSTVDRWHCISPGVPVEMLWSVLAPFSDGVTTLNDCPIEQAMQMTGLGRAETLMAQQRGYSIPIRIDDPAVERPLKAAARSAGFRTIQGGRFLHLQGACDKGQALALIRDTIAARTGQPDQTIALGDSENDLDMLQAADIPVVVRTDDGYRVKVRSSRTIYTARVAPDGWVEGLLAALRDIEPPLNGEPGKETVNG